MILLRSGARFFMLVAIVALAAACTASPVANSTASPGASALPSATASGSSSMTAPAASSVTQTTIDWGRIWDSLPPGVPAYPGAQATETGSGPASATLELPAGVDAAATWWRTALEGAGYRIEAVNGPLEDGSIVIDAEGDAGCRVQTSVAPLGDVTVATIYVAADCPFR